MASPTGDFHAALAGIAGMPISKARDLAAAYADAVISELKVRGVAVLPGVGTLKLVSQPAREGVMRGTAWSKPAGKRAHFSAFKAIKETAE